MSIIVKQLKKRRLALGLKQKDMMLRIGISRQQYQHLESKGNPTLETLELMAAGLNSELMLIPKEKMGGVMAILIDSKNSQQENLFQDPWRDLLKDDDE
ncbi:MAG: helix-turn-helix transcriptional regulator [Gammaproteobacteria bacterium]|nr:helix-turn-helix transcriptional regulator [Gammaproteobacteria bacterium]MBP9729750.1 helix-turn-helix transcriptional regulator [Gammaproteobacteria bacterium]